jgi:hypothetical protein
MRGTATIIVYEVLRKGGHSGRNRMMESKLHYPSGIFCFILLIKK